MRIRFVSVAAESVKIKAKYIELTGNVSISALTTDALNTIKGYSNQALDDAKRYTLDQIAKIDKDNNNLIIGAD